MPWSSSAYNRNSTSRSTKTPQLFDFISAAARGDINTLKRIIQNNSSYPESVYVHGKDSNGQTALIQAATNGHINCVEYLLEIGGEEATRDRTSTFNGETPLHRAAWNGHIDVVQLLLDAGANVDSPTSRSGFTPVDYAYCSKQLSIVNLLLDNGGTPPNDTKCMSLKGIKFGGNHTRKHKKRQTRKYKKRHTRKNN